jgi:hypothetical protein
MGVCIDESGKNYRLTRTFEPRAGKSISNLRTTANANNSSSLDGYRSVLDWWR